MKPEDCCAVLYLLPGDWMVALGNMLLVHALNEERDPEVELEGKRKDVSNVVMLTPLCNISISMDLRVMTITEAGRPASEHCLDSYLLETKDITNPLPTLKVGGQQQWSPGITVLPRVQYIEL